MCKSFNWEVFNAIFSALGTIATASAAIIALWSSRRLTVEKLKVEMSDSYVFSDNPSVRYIGVDIKNISYFPVKVKYIGYSTKKQLNKHSRIIFNPYAGEFNKSIEMNDSEFYLLIKKDDFVKTLEEEIKEYFKKNDWLYILVTTSLKTHKIKTKFKVKDFIT